MTHGVLEALEYLRLRDSLVMRLMVMKFAQDILNHIVLDHASCLRFKNPCTNCN